MTAKLLRALLLGTALLVSALLTHAQQGQQLASNAPIYQVSVVGNSVTAISYQNHGSTQIGFEGTPLLVEAKGEAKVESKQGRLSIDAKFKNLMPAQKFGPEYLTYVLWAITPEGKTSNLGEILLNGASSKIQVTTSLQTFGLIVTAEPYYAVSQPSNLVVMENVALPGTTGTIEKVTANYELLDRGEYSYNVAQENQGALSSSNAPLELLEARNAVAIAAGAGAAKYAADALSHAQSSLTNAEQMFAHKGDRKQEIQSARDAVENAADARQITVRRIAEEKAAAERAAEEQRAADAKAAAAAAAAKQQQDELARQTAELEKARAELVAQQEAQAQALAEARAQQEAAARQQAELDKEKAQLQAQAAAQAAAASAAKAQEEAQAQALAEAKALAEQQAAAQAQAAAAQAQSTAAQAQAAAARSEREKEELRATLLEQFNRILPTTDTSRGLKVNMADVLFATAKFDLQPAAREALAKLSGIVEAHPGLKLQIEGYTDSVGSDAYNQKLSEDRAGTVRAYLAAQGVDPGAITSIGYGKANPVASNDTAAGRRQNRRVEIIISGEIIGTQLGAAAPAAPASQN
ncbi:MAG TPA: OmpA family protein [Candidatus Acidoferrales bacterium]|nr:OmpA family protein [Candidatus Acidoferrales bacterium]